MINEMGFVFALVGVTAALMATGRVRFDIISLLVVLALMLSGVLSVGESIAGFGNSVVILIAALLVVGAMLDRTGVARAVGDLILRRGGTSETRLLVLIMVAAALLGALMSSTAVVAVFIPIVLRIANEAKLSEQRLLLPMSYAALISGMLTLIATPPNIVMTEELKGKGIEGFGFFDFTPVGIAVLVVAIAYMLLVGRRLLPATIVAAPPRETRTDGDAAMTRRKMPVAIVIIVVMVILVVFDIVPLIAAVLMAALAAIFTRCLTMDDAYRAIHWSTIVLVAGMLPLADALEKTGGVDLIGTAMMSALGDASPRVMLGAIFLLTAIVGLFLSNTASAVLVAPLAIYVAKALDVSPYPFAVAVVIGASAAFATPVSTPVVTLVVEPGRYRFLDFVKTGVPLLMLTWGVTLLLAPLVFPFDAFDWSVERIIPDAIVP